jgi:carbon monoxide dehydrogenase subunit G
MGMASTRSHVFIDRPADEVWKEISDPEALTNWFPGVTGCTLEGDVRHVAVSRGISVDEKIVTNDSELRRFQYSIIGGPVPVETHLATIDVIDNGEACVVLYAADVTPDSMGPAMQASTSQASEALKAYVERS